MANDVEEFQGLHGSVEPSHGIQAVMHEVQMMHAATVGGTTASVDSGVGGNEEQVSVSVGDDRGDKGGSVRVPIQELYG